MERGSQEEQLDRYGLGEFGDARLKKTAAALHERLIRKQTVCLCQLGGELCILLSVCCRARWRDRGVAT